MKCSELKNLLIVVTDSVTGEHVEISKQGDALHAKTRSGTFLAQVGEGHPPWLRQLEGLLNLVLGGKKAA